MAKIPTKKKKAKKAIKKQKARAVAAEIVDGNTPVRPAEPEGGHEVTAASGALTPTDPVGAYLAEIRKYPLLTKEKENEIAVRYKETGDPELAEILVTSNLRFVVKVAAEYAKFGSKLIDLIQEGNVGLMHAVKEFNPYKGVRLITYAVWWIRGYIQEYLMKQYSMVRIGTTQNQRKLFYQLKKEREQMEQEGLVPTNLQLSERLGVKEEEVEMMSMRMGGRDISLDQPLDSDSSSSLMDFQSDNQEDSIDEQLSHMELLERLLQNIEKVKPNLNERELELLEQRLLADEPLTLQEIGDKYGITREAVRQMEARLMNKIKKVFLEDVIEMPGSNEES